MERLGEVLYQVGSDDLSEVIRELRALARRVDAASVVTITEARSRGVEGTGADRVGSASRAGLREWITALETGTDQATINKVVTLSTSAEQPRHRVLTDAVSAAEVSLTMGAAALREYESIRPLLADGAQDEG